MDSKHDLNIIISEALCINGKVSLLFLKIKSIIILLREKNPILKTEKIGVLW